MLLSPTAPALSGGGWTVQSYDLGAVALELFFITWEKHSSPLSAGILA